MSGNENLLTEISEDKDAQPIGDAIKIHTIDNITYTVKSRSSETATQSLQAKLEAIIGRDIAKTAAN